jgi:hypothetical protein
METAWFNVVSSDFVLSLSKDFQLVEGAALWIS